MTDPVLPTAAPDLTPLAWVNEELRRTLEGVHKGLRRTLREYDLRLASNQLDVAQTRTALGLQATAMHQAGGAVQMVALREGALVLQANEGLLRRMTEAAAITLAQVEAVERADFAVLTYITRLLAGGRPSPLSLFPVYRAVQELNQAERIHPADFWPSHFEWHALPPVALQDEVPSLEALRTAFDAALLRQMRQPSAQHAAQLAELCKGLSHSLAREPLASFWQLAAAHYESLGLGLVEADAFVKRLGSRLVAQLRSHAQGHDDVSERLVQDLLFFNVQSREPVPGTAPCLEAVRAAYELRDLSAGDYRDDRLGRIDPSWIAQAQRRLQVAKEAWGASAEGEAARAAGMEEAFGTLSESLMQLFPNGELLGQTLQRAAVVTARAGHRPPAALAMEVASAMLYIDAALEDAVFDHPEQAARVGRLAERVQQAATGQGNETLEPWMEDVYRRVSDRQTMSGVVQELRHSLNEVERLVDEYFRDPVKHRPQLVQVQSPLTAMRGVLSVLGMPQAAIACVRMRDEVDRLAETEVDPSLPGPRAVFDRLASNLGQLGFLIDMLNVQPQLAKSMFRFDEDKGELVAEVAPERRTAPQAEPALVDQVRAAVKAAPEDPAALARDLERLALQAAADDQPKLAAVTQGAARELDMPALDITSFDLPDLELPALPELSADSLPPLDVDTVTGTEALNAFLDSQIPAVAAPAPAPVPVAAQSDEEIDEEMLEIFLEEADEVVGNAREALAVLNDEPADRAQITNVRRAFHTLKGSSRMVGLNAYGEAAWAVEQLYNKLLADEAPLPQPVRGFTAEALNEFAAWRQDIEAGTAGARSPDSLRARAEAYRLGTPVPAAVETEAVLVAEAPAEASTASADDTVQAALSETVFSGDHGLDPVDTEFNVDLAMESLAQEPVPADLADDELLDLAAALEADADATLPMLRPGEAGDHHVDFEHTSPFEMPDLSPQASVPADEPVDLIDLGMDADATLALPEMADEPSLDLTSLDLALPDAPAAPELPVTVDELVHVDLGEPTVQDSLAEPEALPDLHLTLDMSATPSVMGELDAPVVVESADLVLPEPAGIDLAEALAPADDAPETLLVLDGEIGLPEAEPLAEPQDAVPAAGLSFSQTEDALSTPTEPEAAPAAEAAPVAGSSDEDEGYKRIGDLRISETLYGIFIGEADEHARRLTVALHDWSQVHDEAPPSSTEVYAHALAGNAATVGFEALSALARALEHALGRAQQALGWTADDAALFTRAGDSIAHLLHQFAAGFLKTPEDGLVPALQAYQPAMRAFEPSTELGDLLDAPAPAPATVLSLPDDDDFVPGEPDQIDDELWEIFEEEASDLLHQLQGRLRDWTTHPQDVGRGDACMRTLHTFKGGARLAGAMRLGELAHRLETEVATLMAASERSAGDVVPLQHKGDDIDAEFERLRKHLREGGKAAPVVVAPVQAPTVPVAAEAPAAEPAVAPTPVEPTETEDLAPRRLEREVAAPVVVEQPLLAPTAVDWSRFVGQDARELEEADAAPLVSAQAMVRVRANLLDRLAAQAGEVSIRRARMESELSQMKTALLELDDNLERLRTQLRELEVQAEAQISSRQEQAKVAGSDFDPLEFDRYTRFQEVTRMLAESVNDVATVQRSLQRNVAQGEDELAAQSRLTRELQDDLLRSRMVEFDSLAERLHRVVRQAARESGKQAQLEIAGGGIELDRGVLERLIGAFEHLLRNSVVHGIEAADVRAKSGKAGMGTLRVRLSQEGNQVLIAFSDDGAGLNLAGIRDKASKLGLLPTDREPTENELVQMIYAPGFSTASSVSELAGRGVGMDVVRSEVNTLGGYVLTRTQAGKGTEFDLRVPLTTALTQVVLLRCGELQVAVPASLVDTVLRLPNAQLTSAYATGQLKAGATDVPLYWLGGLLAHDDHPQLHGKHAAVVLVHSGPDRIAIHVDEVIGNQEVVVKNLGPQLMHVPGLAGISLLASGAVALIYNPVALAERYGHLALARSHQGDTPVVVEDVQAEAQAPLILVVDDSLTVRRVSQRFLEREGYRVMLAKDGLDAMEQLARDELPDMVLSDIEMPRMDGFDLVRNIRADQRLKALPVVMITSRIAEKHREYAQALGVQGYLGKPYDEEHLLGLIRQHTRHLVAA